MAGLSRRALLRAGLAGSAAVAAVSLGGCGRGRTAAPADAPARAALSPHGEEILRAVIPVFAGSLLDGAKARANVLESGVASVDDYLASLSSQLQDEARTVFATLDLLPARLLLLGTTRRWREAPPEAVEAFLRAARGSRFFVLRRIYVFLQSMAELAIFDEPAIWREIGYPGPPIGPYAGAGQPA